MDTSKLGAGIASVVIVPIVGWGLSISSATASNTASIEEQRLRTEILLEIKADIGSMKSDLSNVKSKVAKMEDRLNE